MMKGRKKKIDYLTFILSKAIDVVVSKSPVRKTLEIWQKV